MLFKRSELQAPFMIVGLGNPGLEYRYSRHNFGFMVLDALSERWSVPLKKIKFKAVYGEDRFKGNKVVLVKPLTFMNESGRAVAPLLRFYKCPPENMLVIHDDLDLPLGTLRIRFRDYCWSAWDGIDHPNDWHTGIPPHASRDQPTTGSDGPQGLCPQKVPPQRGRASKNGD